LSIGIVIVCLPVVLCSRPNVVSRRLSNDLTRTRDALVAIFRGGLTRDRKYMVRAKYESSCKLLCWIQGVSAVTKATSIDFFFFRAMPEAIDYSALWKPIVVLDFWWDARS